MDKPCPQCAAPGTVSIELRYVARPIGTFSLAGAQMKVSARVYAVLVCSECDLRVYGHIDGGYFVSEKTPVGATDRKSG